LEIDGREERTIEAEKSRGKGGANRGRKKILTRRKGRKGKPNLASLRPLVFCHKKEKGESIDIVTRNLRRGRKDDIEEKEKKGPFVHTMGKGASIP